MKLIKPIDMGLQKSVNNDSLSYINVFYFVYIMKSMEPIHVKLIPQMSIFNSLSFKQATERILLKIIIHALLLAKSI